jgi:hypothetical protein
VGQCEAALARYARARAGFEALGRTDGVALCDLIAGNTLRDLDRPQEALAYYARARAGFEALGDAPHVAGCDLDAGFALKALGRPQEGV